MKTFLTIERTTQVNNNKHNLVIPKGETVELVAVNSTHRGALFRIRTPSGVVTDLEPRSFNQTQVQPLLREAYSRR